MVCWCRSLSAKSTITPRLQWHLLLQTCPWTVKSVKFRIACLFCSTLINLFLISFSSVQNLWTRIKYSSCPTICVQCQATAFLLTTWWNFCFLISFAFCWMMNLVPFKVKTKTQFNSYIPWGQKATDIGLITITNKRSLYFNSCSTWKRTIHLSDWKLFARFQIVRIRPSLRVYLGRIHLQHTRIAAAFSRWIFLFSS